MHPALKAVMERLPEMGEQTRVLFERDETFRDLCEEYQACSDASARLDAAPASEAALRREYAALRLRLEGELLRYLGEDVGA